GQRLQRRETTPATRPPTRPVGLGLRLMAEALRATPSAQATGVRSRTPQADGCGAQRAGTLHRDVSCSVFPTCTALNSTPRFVRGIPYPLTFDSVRCHA